MQRFPELKLEQMTSMQQKVAREIAAGPRGGLRGPFNAWLRCPELADLWQKVGEYIRFHSSLPRSLNELAILITARVWTAQFEWYAHYKLAMEAGLSPAIAAAIAEGRRPEAMSDDERIVYDFCTELQEKKSVGDAAYAAAVGRFGEQGVVELISACGYYTAVSMTLNVADVAVPDDSVPRLKKLPG
ncbi:MAG: carboxymuconolactone decarboxylase family protein [Acidisphaera sp.]|nr:carboxymuconolactone decarboxylase family protein [Acidisphaera sp.]